MGVVDRLYKVISFSHKTDDLPPPRRKKVYCGECKYFEKELNPYYYMDKRPEVETGVLFQCRQSSYKHNVKCLHPENIKVHVRQIHDYDKVRLERFTNERSPRSINYENKCQWFTKKDDCDWEVEDGKGK